MEETRVIKLDKYDYKLIINEFRNMKIKENIDTEIIDDLLMKLFDAPVEKSKIRGERYISAR